MIIKMYDALPEDAAKIRQTVFVEEQGFEEEFDTIDQEAKHFVAYENDEAVGTCRIFYSEKESTYMMGRLAVLKESRGLHAGEQLVAAAEEYIKEVGGDKCVLSSQVRASGFYKKQGYEAYGEEYLDEYCPHIRMEKAL